MCKHETTFLTGTLTMENETGVSETGTGTKTK